MAEGKVVPLFKGKASRSNDSKETCGLFRGFGFAEGLLFGFILGAIVTALWVSFFP